MIILKLVSDRDDDEADEIIQATNTNLGLHIDDGVKTDDDDDIEVIDLEEQPARPPSVSEAIQKFENLSINSSTNSPRPSSAQGSSSIVSVNSSGGDSRKDAKDEVVVILSNETVLEESNDQVPKESDVSPDMSHVSVVVVGGGDENSVQVVDSSRNEGITMSNGMGDLSDLSRSFSSASHTSSEASGRRSGTGSRSQSSVEARERMGSPNSIIIEGIGFIIISDKLLAK